MIEKLETQEKKTRAPALYDLLALQKEANRQFGYTAQETLDIAQSLYEEFKVMSDPALNPGTFQRTWLTSCHGFCQQFYKQQQRHKRARNAFTKEGITPGNITADLLRPRLSKSYVDDTKLTDHHAIIPTHKTPPADLPEKQHNLYILVADEVL